MRFQPRAFNLFSATRALLTSAFALAIVVSCSDNTGPVAANGARPVQLKYVDIYVPDSIKDQAASASNAVAFAGDASKLLAASSVESGLSGLVAVPASYKVSNVAFAPEPAPGNRIPMSPGPGQVGGNDGYTPNVPLGFNFSFFGNSYDKVNVFANGLVTFGPTDSAEIARAFGWYKADLIPFTASPNNLIALAWSDWSPSRAGLDAIRYETRGSAPNRRFVLQYTSVPEFGTFNLMTVQLVLTEGSNRVVISTTTMTTSRNLVTQGIENVDGMEAAYDSIQHPILLSWHNRVRFFVKITNDAVRFTPNQPPVVTVPADISTFTDPAPSAAKLSLASLAESLMPGMCTATVNPGTATAVDEEGDEVTMTVARSDALALDKPYPKGVTTITWTATDAGGKAKSAVQTVTVIDSEKPLIAAPASLTADNDPGLATALVEVGNAPADDNCTKPLVASGTRNDGEPLSAPYPVGATTIEWVATDESGNSSTAFQTVTVADVEAPSMNSFSNITVDAVVPDGAVVSFASLATDNVKVTSLSCSKESGSVFPIGPTSVTCTARDAAGNSTSKMFTVTVRGAHEQIADLTELLSGMNLPSGTANPMLNHLRSAYRDTEGGEAGNIACKKMQDFMALLDNRKTSGMSADEIAPMLEDARRIMIVIGCA